MNKTSKYIFVTLLIIVICVSINHIIKNIFFNIEGFENNNENNAIVGYLQHLFHLKIFMITLEIN